MSGFCALCCEMLMVVRVISDVAWDKRMKQWFEASTSLGACEFGNSRPLWRNSTPRFELNPRRNNDSDFTCIHRYRATQDILKKIISISRRLY